MKIFAKIVLLHNKNQDKYLNKYLQLREIECKCVYPECTLTLYSPSTVESFFGLRDAFGSAIHVNSGFRCQKHNDDIGGKVNSMHCRGQALDLSVSDPSRLKSLKSLASQFFDVVIEYDGFIHCHNL
jgi:hypothetical protein